MTVRNRSCTFWSRRYWSCSTNLAARIVQSKCHWMIIRLSSSETTSRDSVSRKASRNELLAMLFRADIAWQSLETHHCSIVISLGWSKPAWYFSVWRLRESTPKPSARPLVTADTTQVISPRCSLMQIFRKGIMQVNLVAGLQDQTRTKLTSYGGLHSNFIFLFDRWHRSPDEKNHMWSWQLMWRLKLSELIHNKNWTYPKHNLNWT